MNTVDTEDTFYNNSSKLLQQQHLPSLDEIAYLEAVEVDA